MKIRRAFTFASGLAVGYVAGSAAGRERYEQISSAASGFADRIGAKDASRRISSRTRDVVRSTADQAVAVSRDAVDTTTGKIEGGLDATDRRLNGSPAEHSGTEEYV
jgi:hypothetical protein